MRSPYRKVLPLVAASVFGAVTTAALAAEVNAEPMPNADVFQPLLADPKEPRFHMSVLETEGALRETTVGAVGFGENVGFMRWRGARDGDGWQIGFSAAVFAQFDLHAPSMELVNADYTVGVPLTYRQGDFSARTRVYHQSSHLGDEFILRMNPERVNLSYEALELLLSYDIEGWRVYGGGEYLFHREPEELASGALHAGVEYRRTEPAFRIADLGGAYFVAATDTKGYEQHDWRQAWSVKTGFEFRPLRDVQREGRHWSLMLEYYDGPSPYGQFYTYEVSYYGLGVALSL